MELLGLFFYLAVIVFSIVVLWIVYGKAGKPGWGCIVPIYNIMLLCDIAGKSRWWTVLFFVPLVNIVVDLLLCLGVAKNFRETGAFGVGLWLMPPIFFAILAFGGTGCKPSPTSQSLPEADSEAAVGSSPTIVGFLDTTVPRLLTEMEQMLDKSSLSGEECREIEQRLKILVAAVNKGGQSAQQIKATLERVRMLKRKLTDAQTRVTKPETRDSEDKPVQGNTTPENHCTVCDRDLGSAWHYYFESLSLGDTIGVQCPECKRRVCKEHIESGADEKHLPMACPDCGAECLELQEGPAYSSMVEQARSEGRYRGGIEEPTERGRSVVDETDTRLRCPHCSRLFDFTKAEHHHGANSGWWFICPHCRNLAPDNIHPDCPYWTDWLCRHDPAHETVCSLPTAVPYQTCYVL